MKLACKPKMECSITFKGKHSIEKFSMLFVHAICWLKDVARIKAKLSEQLTSGYAD